MINYHFAPGSTSKSVIIRIVDSVDGTPETGVTSGTSGLDLKYRRELAATVDLTEADLAALTTAFTSDRMLHIGSGYYRIDIPNGALAAGVDGVLLFGTCTGMVIIGCYIHLNTMPADVQSYGGTAIPTTDQGGPGIIRRFTAAAVGVNYIDVDAGGSTVDQYYRWCDVTIISATTGAGQTQQCVDYIASPNKRMTFPDNWITTPTGTVVCIITPNTKGLTSSAVTAALEASTLAELLNSDKGYVKNVAVTTKPFPMHLTTGLSATGKTVTVQISKDGGAFANVAANSGVATEMSVGWYKIALSQAEMNADEIAIQATASGCLPTDFMIRTTS